jgi:tellurite resistance protein TerC
MIVMLSAMQGQGALWVVFALLVSTVVALDLGLFQKKAHEPTVREALGWTGLWIGLAVLFGAGVFWQLGSAKGTQFFAAYLLEKALSVDNLFVLLLVFAQFRVPRKAQRKVLVAGVLGAIVLRGVLIVAGASLLSRFHVLTYGMGVFLLVAAARLVFAKEPVDDGMLVETPAEESFLIRALRRVLPISPEFDGAKFTTRAGGRFALTPLVLALVAIETADVVFAVDSIPAVFGVTTDPFIALTSNLFAILGLRSLYFLLADLLERLRYLKAGLAGVLGFVGLKMVLSFAVEISAPVSLLVILFIMGAATAASLYAPSTSKGTDEC